MLSFIASIYGQVASLRNCLYDQGIFETFDLGARTISIGNITAGGTGKTPLVAYVAEFLAASGEKVCVLTRGYGREDVKDRVLVSDGVSILADPREAGDEPFELAQKLLRKAVVIADADRVSAAEWAERKFGVTAFVLDDAFQHRQVRRDLDIVCVDATDPFGGGKMLPAGRLREPIYNLKRADIVVITRANLAGDLSNLKFEISELNVGAAIFATRNEIATVAALEEFCAMARRSKGDSTPVSSGSQSSRLRLKTHKALAFCGLGNPENFFEQLRRGDLSITATKTFRDHHVYTPQDIVDIETLARENGVKLLLTTAKDAVKLSNLKFTIPCFVVEIRMIIDDAETFESML